MSPESRIFSHAKWIWPVSPHWDIHNGYALFRTGFKLAAVPKRAPLFITADQAYRLYVNGRHVARGPARGFQASWPYDEVNLAPYLQKGYNQIAVRAYNPGFSNFQYLSQTFAGLLVAARWGKFVLNSDASWKAIREPGTRRDTVPTSLQLFPQEHVDLRESPADWTAAKFDDRAWEEPTARPWNAAPWFSLEPRSIPLLEERELPPGTVVGVGHGTCVDGYHDTRDVVALRQREDRTHQPANAAMSCPLKIAATGKHKFRSYLIDFGRTVVGSLKFAIQGAKGGEIIDTHYCETVDASTLTPDQVFPTHCRMAFGDRLVLRAGENTHPLFHAYGFRYLMITVRNTTGPLELDYALEWIGYPLPRQGGFDTSDGDLARIWEMCAWTQQCCSLDAYVDTPWREQAQWWGDARVQAWNTFHLSGDTRLLDRGIRQIASQTTPDGVTYGHAPTMAHSCILPDFTLVWILTLWDSYWQSGSTAAFEEHIAVVERALAFFKDNTDPQTDLIINDDRYWLFLDWTDIFKDGTATVYNLWLLIALDKLTALYRLTNRSRKATNLAAWAKRLRTALGKLLDADGLMRDGIDRQGHAVSSTSIHAQTLAILAGIKGLNTEGVLNRIILPWIRGEAKPLAIPSAYWVTYVFGVMIDNGRAAEVVGFIRQHWLPMVDHGTTWENLAPRRGDESHSHAWSAHPLYHFMQTIGGLSQTGPAWTTVRFAPLFEGDHGGATIPSPAGKITSAWKRTRDGQVRVSLSLPKGVTAEVVLPGLPKTTATGRQRWLV